MARPVFRVGVTGQRPDRLPLHPVQIERRCLDALTAIGKGARGHELVAVSGLAEGAERAFAEAALLARFRLEAVLPFEARSYERLFPDQLGVATYRTLLTRASHVHAHDGDFADVPGALREAGATLTDASDLLVAVWDGDAHQPPGTTPDVIAMMLARRKPVIWIDATGRRERRYLPTPSPRDAVTLNLGTYKGHAIAMGRKRLSRLVSHMA